MRKFLLFLTALLMPVFALDMWADDEEAVTKIPLKTVEKTYVWNSLTQGPQYKTETSYEYESFVAINWGWDGSGMYSGTEPIWYNADVINWTVGSHTFTSVDGMVYGFAKIS